jgi:hypothetical protein
MVRSSFVAGLRFGVPVERIVWSALESKLLAGAEIILVPQP